MFRIHISALIVHDGRILLVREEKPENHGKWNLPGGHLEAGEGLQEGVLRELTEETGLEGTVRSLLGVYSSTRRPRPSMRLVFHCEADGVPVAGDQILEVAWFTPEELRALPDEALVCAPMLRQIVTDGTTGRGLPLPWEAAPVASAP